MDRSILVQQPRRNRPFVAIEFALRRSRLQTLRSGAKVRLGFEGCGPMAASSEQLHSAFSYCVDFARHMLQDSGSFLPFGAALNTSGDVKAVAGWNGEEHPAPAEIYQILSSALREEAANKKILGSAVAVDVNIPVAYDPPSPDGIRVHLEGDGYSRYIYVPYTIKTSGLLRRKREIMLAEPFSVEVPAEVFAMQ